MTSTASVNFSIRQNKAIERQLVFDGIRAVVHRLGLDRLAYVGLGSVWFADFLMAHRQLGIKHLHSIEMDSITYSRAKFNKPFGTVRVHEGESSKVIPSLLKRRDIKSRSWIVWLDFDRRLYDQTVQELCDLVVQLPRNSFLVTTFVVDAKSYGKLEERREFVEEIFGKLLDPVSTAVLKDDDQFGSWLSQVLEDHLAHHFVKMGRVGAFVPSFKLTYRDGRAMATVGAFLAADETSDAVIEMCSSAAWPGRPSQPISTTPLTLKEVTALQAKLPRTRRLTRTDVQRMGFDLEIDQIELYQDYYLHFPAFAQIVQ